LVTLKRYNSRVEISCPDPELLQRLKKLLYIYWTDPRDKAKVNSIYIGRGSSFPAGYLSQFEKKAQAKKIAYQVEDYASEAVPRQRLNLSCPLSLMAHQEAALAAVKNNRVGIVSSPTASGKSLMIALAIAERGTTTLVVTPTTSIRDDLADSCRQWFGAKAVSTEIPVMPWAPGLNDKPREEEGEGPGGAGEGLEDSPFAYLLKKKASKKGKEPPFERAKRLRVEAIKRKISSGSWHKPITIVCWQSLPQLPKKYVASLGCVIIDECHTSAAKAIRDLLFNAESAAYRYGFSATPWRDQPHMLKLMQSAIGSEVIFDYAPEDAIEEGVIAKPNLNIIEAAFPKSYLKKVKSYRKILDDGVIRNKARNQQIVKKAIELFDDNSQVFIAIDEIGHFEGKVAQVGEDDGAPVFAREKDVSYSLKALFEAARQEVVFISGDDTAEMKKEKIKALRETDGGFILVGTMAVGIGTDIPGINKIILASTGKSSIRFIQRIGRGMRTNNEENKQLEVFDFMDRWNPLARSYTIERVKAFTKHFKGCKVYGF
jgi:superfamily II DNA or RNA helicase